MAPATFAASPMGLYYPTVRARQRAPTGLSSYSGMGFPCAKPRNPK
jgi:hypothetical protein